MIHGIRKGQAAAFPDVLKYNFGKPDAQILTSNMEGEDVESLLDEFRQQVRLNPNIQKPMVHANIRLPPDEALTPYQWSHVVDVYLEHLGYEECPFVAFLESTAPDQAHVHIVACSIQDNGKRVSDSFDYYKGQRAMRQLEEYFDLRRVPNSWEVGKKAPTFEEVSAAIRTQEPNIRYSLQKKVDEAAQGEPTLTQFLHRLQDQGVDVNPRLTRNGRFTGITYRLANGGSMRGSDLGKNFAWPGLEQRLGVDYDPARDLPALLEAQERFASADPTQAAKTFIKSAVDQAVDDAPDLPELVRRLQALGVGVQPNLARTGHLSGLTYHYRGAAFKASDLGRAYAPKGLERRGVHYRADDHHHEMRELENARQGLEADPGTAPVHSGQAGGGLEPQNDEQEATTSAQVESGRAELSPGDEPDIIDFYWFFEKTLLAEQDWAHRAASAGLGREEIARTLEEARIAYGLEPDERTAYAERFTERAFNRYELDDFLADPELSEEPFLAERSYVLHAQHHGLDEEQIQHDLLAAHVGELAPDMPGVELLELQELEREDIERLQAAARLEEGSELEAEIEEGTAEGEGASFELDIAVFDAELIEERDAMSRSARELALAADRLHHEPTEEHLGAVERHYGDYHNAARDLGARVAGLDLPRDLELHLEHLEAQARRALDHAALGEAQVRARRLDELAQAYAAQPDRSIYLRYLAEERSYRRLARSLERQRIDTRHEFAGGRGPAGIAAEAERKIASARALDFARRSEEAARHFKNSLGRRDLESYERFSERARSQIASAERDRSALPTGARRHLAQARDHLDRAQRIAELGGPPQEESRLKVAYESYRPRSRDPEVELYQAARDLREHAHQLPADPSREALRELGQLRRRFDDLEQELGVGPRARHEASVERYEELHRIEERFKTPGESFQSGDLQRLGELHRELEALEAGEPPAGWNSDLGPQAQALAAEVEPRFAEIDVERYSRWMAKAAQREFHQPSQEHLEDFYRARGAFHRALENHRSLELPEPEGAVRRAEEARLVVAAVPLREAAERLDQLAGTDRVPSAEELHEARRDFERPLRLIVRRTEPEAAREIHEKISDAYQRLGRARLRFERFPDPAAHGDLSAARREIAGLYGQAAELERRVLREQLPEVAGPAEAARAAEAELGRHRAEELATEMASKLQGWRSSDHLRGDLDLEEIREPLRELDRLELRHGATLGEAFEPLRSRVETAEFNRAAERLHSLYQTRDDDAPLNPEHLRAVSAAEEHFLRAAAARPAQAEPWRRHFEAIIDRHLQRSTDQLVDRARPTGEQIALGPDPLRQSLWRVAGDLVSYQRFHQALPELPDQREYRSLRPVISALRYVQERIDRAIERHEPVKLTPKLAEFLRYPQAAAARAADQHWADRRALEGHSFHTIRDVILKRAANPYAPKVDDVRRYAEEVAQRAVSLARRVRPPVLQALKAVARPVGRAIPAELRLLAKGAGLLTPKATPLALASFLYAVGKSVQRQMARAKEESREGGRGRSR